MKLHDQEVLKVMHVKFLCTIPGKPSLQTIEFDLGDGPCGRHVEELMVEFTEHFLKVTQWSSADGDELLEVKDFIYKMSDVRGRITVTR